MIVKIWPIKAEFGGLERNLRSSMDYIQDPLKTARTTQGQDLALEYDELPEETRETISHEEFVINNEDNFNRVMRYVKNENKTDGYVSGYLCDPHYAVKDFIETKRNNLNNIKKTLADDTGNHAYHIVQSFPGELDIDDEEVHRCGQELVEKLGLYQAVICSHVHPVTGEDNEVHGKCKHNHIIINSHIYHEFIDPTNPQKMKYHDCKESYALLQLYNDQIAMEHGLPIILSQELDNTYSWYETDKQNEGKSWKARVRMDIENAMRVTNSFEEYKAILENEGYSLREGNSQQHGHYVTYTTPNGKRVRDYILGQSSTFEQLMTYWAVKKNLAEVIQKNAETEGKTAIHTILEETKGQVFINIRRTVGNNRKKRMEEAGKTAAKYYTYNLPIPSEYDESMAAEKTYFDPQETYQIYNDQNRVLATVSGAEILRYYQALETEQRLEEKKRQEEYYSNPHFINHRTDQPYMIPAYDENGRRRSLVEMIFILAVVVLNKEEEYFGVTGEDIITEQKNDPVYAQRAWKVENMLESLRVAREEQIETLSQVDDRLNEVGKSVSKSKAAVRRLTQTCENVALLKAAIDEYHKMKALCDPIFAMPDGQDKENMKKRHAAVLAKYSQAKATMYRHKVMTDEDVADFERRYRQYTERLEMAQETLADAKVEYRRLSKLRYNLQLAQNRQYVYGPGYKEKEQMERTEAIKDEAVK